MKVAFGSEMWLCYPFLAVEIERGTFYARVGTLRLVWFRAAVFPRLAIGQLGPSPAPRKHWNLTWDDRHIAGTVRNFWGMDRPWGRR